MNNCLCIIDCRVDICAEFEFLSLDMWGRPTFSYVTEECLKSGLFSAHWLVTNSEMIRQAAEKNFGDRLLIMDMLPEPSKGEKRFLVSGGAVLLKRSTMARALEYSRGRCLCSAVMRFGYTFDEQVTEILSAVNVFLISDGQLPSSDNATELFAVSENEAVTADTKSGFELALVLKRKERLPEIDAERVKNRISEKREILRGSLPNSVCLVGHSQFDEWTIDTLAGVPVKNCGIDRITAALYDELILHQNLFHCDADIYVVMFGTNDLLYEKSDTMIAERILRVVRYIKNYSPRAPVLFLSCLHINGRIDRSNRRIDQLNEVLKSILKNETIWIDTSELDDEFGNLKQTYTRDGLHLSREGYIALRALLERHLFEIEKCLLREKDR